MNDYEKEDVVVPQVDEIAIYFNDRREVVIRQINTSGEHDATVVVPFEHVKAVIKKLQEMVKNRPAG